ncbi:Cytochrome c oxidase-assembly factor COX16,mitochondrial [Wickerhamomyces ciferrii]|uniref:Cytochrome c oxidase assembly protein COX16, mitochondrial n=1 Tax=Wickerhamomyces ciferrii (strain ATCC 14091 / BCRC 22168 / CBS 111 / JCM 3599 / NBRC 0793 / NRRL Y-1031 F-60-10) TaxID=1206466 RepID=K0KPN3_WICCF|nr:Cytochrome c oxidase-assembly factor COX16,mitochondrial [Wickerhamomyces ciferrii]CCH43123.1 Cytochrome c oxidase-assembly factor COX16,mitochondrial [Wickerhamomyces ciferrii]
MSDFGGKRFRSKRDQAIYDASWAGRYQKQLRKSPFLVFGGPFLVFMGLASYWLSGFTAVRYEQRDQRVQEVTESDIIKLNTKKRNVDVKEEYYRLQGLGEQDWEPKRVPRMKGESENVW